MRLVWTERALTDLIKIEDYIAEDNFGAAIALVERLMERAEWLRENPKKRRIVPELGAQNYRELIVKGYRLVYRLRSGKFEVLQVFEGSCQLMDP